MPSRNDSLSKPNARAYPKDRPSNRLRVRQRPPIDSCAGDQGAWAWRTNSPIYRRRVKRAIQSVQTYLLMARGDDSITTEQRDAVHRLLDTLTFDPTRRVRTGGAPKDIFLEA